MGSVKSGRKHSPFCEMYKVKYRNSDISSIWVHPRCEKLLISQGDSRKQPRAKTFINFIQQRENED